MPSTVALVLGIVSLLIWWLFYIPIAIIHLLRFNNFRHDISLTKRYASVSITTVSISIFWIAIYSILMINYYFMSSPSSALVWLFNVSDAICNFSVASTIAWRFWLNYYAIQFTTSASRREWQKFIENDAQFDNWYFQNKQRFGSFKWTLKRVLILMVIGILLFLALSVFSGGFPVMLRFLLLACPWICTLIIYLKCPSFFDEFFLRKEMKYILFSYSSIFVFFIISVMILYLVSDLLIVLFLFVNFTVGIIFLNCLIQTYWVLSVVDVGFDDDDSPLKAPLNPFSKRKRKGHFTANSNSYQQHEWSQSSSTASTSRTSKISAYSGNNNNNNKRKNPSNSNPHSIVLSDMFSDIKYLSMFFGHLSREFSMECLLSMIEIVQLQNYILLHMQLYKNYYFKQFSQIKIVNKTPMNLVKLPRSSIIYSNSLISEEEVEQYLHNEDGRIIAVMEREQVRVRLICYKLFEKYIKIGSEWEINISYENRNALTTRMMSFNAWMSKANRSIQMAQLAMLYEDSKHEMYRLLRHSFSRFKRSDPEFKKITKIKAENNDSKLKRPVVIQNTKQTRERVASQEDDNDLVDTDDIINEIKQNKND